jgi:acetyltransferase-like isoleucine patch superfamily enzyme
MLIKNKRIPVKSIILIGFLPSFLKILIYKLRGYKIGKKVKIGFGSIILGDNISVGEETKLGLFSIISCCQCEIENNVDIGSFVYMKVDKITIGAQTIIRENNQFGGLDLGKSELNIGKMSHIHQRCIINTTMPVNIGSHTAIGGGSYIFTHSSWQSALDGYPCTFEKVEIGDNVWISWNVFILPGVKIGNGTLVSAGAGVTKSLPSRSLASGNPARVVIPSGMFPREPHPEEKTSLLINIIDEFGEFLKSKKLNFKEVKKNNHIKYIVTDNKSKKHFLLLILDSNIDFDSFKLEKNITLLFNYNIDSNSLNLNNKRGISVVDIKQGKSYGNSEISNELIKFLKHYGIRLQTTKK